MGVYASIEKYYFSQGRQLLRLQDGGGAVIVLPELDQKCIVKLKMH